MRLFRSLFTVMFCMAALGCAKDVELTPADEAYLLLPRDIRQFDLPAYRLKTYRSGRQYIFLRSRTALNGLASGYRVTLLDKEGNEIVFNTQVNVQSSVDRARELFEGSKRISSVIGREHVVSLDVKTYQAEELFLLNTKKQYYMVLRSGKLVYLLNIEGTELSEQQVRAGMQEKFAAARKLE